MKKLAIVALSVILMIGLFVSCSNEVQQQEPTAYITFDGDGSRAISSTNQGLPGVSELHWKFEATKQDGGLKTGETSEQKDVNSGVGLSGAVGPFSIGSWKFILYGYKDSALVYQGETFETLSAGETKSIAVDVKYAGNNDNGFVKVKNLTLMNNGSAVSGNENLAKLILSATRQDQVGSIEETVLNIDDNGNFNTAENISVAPGVYQFTFTFKDAENRVVSDIQSKYILILGGQTTTLSGDVNEYKQQASFEANNYYEQFGNHFYVVMNTATGLNATQEAARKYSEDNDGIETYIYLNGEIVTRGSSINFSSEEEANSRAISNSMKVANITLILNGNTIKHESETAPALVINNEGLTLTIKDDTNLGSVTSTGKGIVVNAGNLKIEGGIVSANKSAIVIDTQASVIISGSAKLSSPSIEEAVVTNKGNLLVDGGSISGNIAIKLESDSTTSIENGIINIPNDGTQLAIDSSATSVKLFVSQEKQEDISIPEVGGIIASIYDGGLGIINSPFKISNENQLKEAVKENTEGTVFLITNSIVLTSPLDITKNNIFLIGSGDSPVANNSDGWCDKVENVNTSVITGSLSIKSINCRISNLIITSLTSNTITLLEENSSLIIDTSVVNSSRDAVCISSIGDHNLKVLNSVIYVQGNSYGIVSDPYNDGNLQNGDINISIADSSIIGNGKTGVGIFRAEKLNLDINNSLIDNNATLYGIRLTRVGSKNNNSKVNITSSKIVGWGSIYYNWGCNNIATCINDTTVLGNVNNGDNTYGFGAIVMESTNNCNMTINGGSVISNEANAATNKLFLIDSIGVLSNGNNKITVSETTELKYGATKVTNPNIVLSEVYNMIYHLDSNEQEAALNFTNNAVILVNRNWNDVNLDIATDNYVIKQYDVGEGWYRLTDIDSSVASYAFFNVEKTIGIPEGKIAVFFDEDKGNAIAPIYFNSIDEVIERINSYSFINSGSTKAYALICITGTHTVTNDKIIDNSKFEYGIDVCGSVDTKDENKIYNLKIGESLSDKIWFKNVERVATDWYEVADTSWYSDANDTFTISTAEQLAGFASLVNEGKSFTGKTVSLGDNINLSGKEWTPIGVAIRSGKGIESGNSFNGTFKGNNKIISGLTITNDSSNKDAVLGLFGAVNGGKIQNFSLTDVNINVSKSECVGAAAGLLFNNSSASNISVKGSIIAAQAGGVIGRMTVSGTINDCTNNASINTLAGGTGGIVGKAYYSEDNKTITITKCVNNGAITTSGGYTGGIVGLLAGNVNECTNNNTGTIVAKGGSVGGIIGELDAYGTVSSCKNYASITNNLSSSTEQNGPYGTGGIVGWIRYYQPDNYSKMSKALIVNNTNEGSINAPNCTGVGGIVGFLRNIGEVKNNTSSATNIRGQLFVSGIVGAYQRTEDNSFYEDGVSQTTINNNIMNTEYSNIIGSCSSSIIYTNGNAITVQENNVNLPINNF